MWSVIRKIITLSFLKKKGLKIFEEYPKGFFTYFFKERFKLSKDSFVKYEIKIPVLPPPEITAKPIQVGGFTCGSVIVRLIIKLDKGMSSDYVVLVKRSDTAKEERLLKIPSGQPLSFWYHLQEEKINVKISASIKAGATHSFKRYTKHLEIPVGFKHGVLRPLPYKPPYNETKLFKTRYIAI